MIEEESAEEYIIKFLRALNYGIKQRDKLKEFKTEYAKTLNTKLTLIIRNALIDLKNHSMEYSKNKIVELINNTKEI